MPLKFNTATQKWVADYPDQFGKRHRHGFGTKREAKDHLVKNEAAIRDRSFRPEAGKMKLSEVALQFLEASEQRVRRREIEATTHANYRMSVEIYILGTRRCETGPNEGRFPHTLGHLSIGDIDEPLVRDFRGHLIDLGMKAKTVTHQMLALSQILNFAKDRKYVSENIMRGMRFGRTRDDEDDEVYVPEKDTVAQLVELAEPRAALLIAFAAATGLRSSEQRALTWDDIDLENRRVYVRKRVDRFGKVGALKSRAARRQIPLSKLLVESLKQRWEADGKPTKTIVFGSRRGTHISHANLRTRVWLEAWKRLATQSEANGLEPPPYCGWHSLRHFAISTWIEKNLPIKQVQKWAGHATAAITLNTYSHVFESADHSDIIDEIADDILA